VKRSRRGRAAAAAGVAAASAISPLALQAPAKAAAPAPHGLSFYMRSQNSSGATNRGCEVGNLVAGAAGTQLMTTVLGFGAPTWINGVAGATNWTSPDYTVSNVQSLAMSFVNGFMWCAGGDTTSKLRLALATSNDSNSNTNQAHGQAWGSMIAALQAQVNNAGFGSRVWIYGSSDIEPSFNASVANTRAWLNGYLSATSRPFMANNSLDGCPTSGTYSAGTLCNQPSLGGGTPFWTVEDAWYVSGQSGMLPIPQVYVFGQEHQWYRLAKYSKTTKGYKMYFQNTMSTLGACQQLGCGTRTPDQAFDALQNMVNGDSDTAVTIEGDTDVRWADL
jgi:hypothetical protein